MNQLALLFVILRSVSIVAERPFTMGNNDSNHADLFGKYVKRVYPKATVLYQESVSTDMGILDLKDGQLERLLDGYKAEFGVDLRRRTLDGAVVTTYPTFDIMSSLGTTPEQLLAQLGPDSKVGRVLAPALARFNPKKLPITHCHYSIRSWLNKALQKTERVEGYIKAKSRDEGKMFYFGSAHD